jgi:hypothetical protein
MEPIGEDDTSIDPFGKYWEAAASTAAPHKPKAISTNNAESKQWVTETDAFGDPFFVEDNSSVTEYAESRYEPAPHITNLPPSIQPSARFFGTLQMPDLEEFVPSSKMEGPPSRERLRAHEVNQLREAARRSLMSDDENSPFNPFSPLARVRNSAALSSHSLTNKRSASSDNKLSASLSLLTRNNRWTLSRKVAKHHELWISTHRKVYALTGQIQKPTQNMRYAQEQAIIAAAPVS